MSEISNNDLACHPEPACTERSRSVEGQTPDLLKNEERKGYKKTKLGWIPEEWNIYTLKEILKDTKLGGNYNNSSEAIGFPLIKMGNIGRGVVSIENKYFIEDGEELFEDHLLKNGDILFNTRNTLELVGKVAIWKNEYKTAYYNSNLLRLNFNNKQVSSNEFINYCLNSQNSIKQLKSFATGTTSVAAIYDRDVKILKVALPSAKEQTAIAACLSTWDSAIATLTQLIEKKQAVKKGLMQQLLSGKKRLQGFEGEWKVNALSRFLKYTPREVPKPNGKFHKLGIRSHCKGTFLNEDFDSEKIAIDKMYVVEENDLIVNITFAWEGAIAIINKDHEKAYVSHRFPTYTFIKNVSLSDYFKQFIQSKRFRYLLELISPGGAGRNRVMSKKDFLKLKITTPNYEEQTAIAQVLQTADDEISLLTKKLVGLKEQKRGLMQVLLTGRKRLEY